jgi:hypothetical protein
MTQRCTETTMGTVKIHDGQLKVYNGQSERVVEITLDRRVAHQLIHELNEYLRYPS